jgi:hypothetical protein
MTTITVSSGATTVATHIAVTTNYIVEDNGTLDVVNGGRSALAKQTTNRNRDIRGG